MSIYQEHGYVDRRAYLEALAEEMEISVRTVKMMADVLGPSEDFDGLVTELEDYGEEFDEE